VRGAASSNVSTEGQTADLGDAVSAIALGGVPEETPSPQPRKQIWFKRRVSLSAALRELWAFRELTFTLAERDLRIRYKQAVLGLAWALITPVFMMLAFTLIFSHIAHIKTGGTPYALFSYMGLLPWTFFSSAVSTGGMALVGNVPLLNKLYCPREVFPIAGMLDAVVDALIATLVLAVLFPILGFAPKVHSYWIPLLLVVLVVFTTGVTLAVAAVVVYMRDLRLVLPIVIQMGLFVTPVVYSSGAISNKESFLIVYSIVNPLVPVIDGLRRAVLQNLDPQWVPLAAGAASSVVCLLFGFWLFKRLETGMADVA
jgi:ABC-type polysaccharide/polyol phosphate export permease